jgi:hypothetical protein
MKWIKYTVITLLSCVTLLVVAVEIVFYGERPKSEFANYAEAKSSGIMDRGWVPTFIPKSARQIKEQHDLDTNWVKMTFEYDPIDKATTRESCVSENPIEGGIEFTCKYFTNNVSMKLYDSGKADLYSYPN